MITRFTLVRYRADSLRDECRNIGMVAWGAEDWAQRLIPDLPPDLADVALSVVARLRTRLATLGPADRLDQPKVSELLRRFDGPYTTVIFRGDTGSSILDEGAETVLADVWPHFFDDRPGFGHGRWLWWGEGERALTAAHAVVANWDALCRCVDEFAPEDMAACGEHRDHLDTAIVALRAALGYPEDGAVSIPGEG